MRIISSMQPQDYNTLWLKMSLMLVRYYSKPLNKPCSQRTSRGTQKTIRARLSRPSTNTIGKMQVTRSHGGPLPQRPRWPCCCHWDHEAP
jgi:hypothetical protein